MKTEVVVHCVIPECYAPTTLQLVYDDVIAGHPGRGRTLTSARESYFWPTMLYDINAHVRKCAQYKWTVSLPASVLQYPPPDKPWKVVSMDLLQLDSSHEGSRYLLGSVDYLSCDLVVDPFTEVNKRCLA